MTLSENRDRIYSLFEDRSKRIRSGTRLAKIILILGGTLTVAATTVLTGGLSWPLSTGQVIGLFGAIMAFFGGVVVLFLEQDPTDALDSARHALDAAARKEQENGEFREYLRSLDRSARALRSLYAAVAACRGVLEQAIRDRVTDPLHLITVCLDSSKRNFRAGFGFELDDTWTICIYRAYENGKDDRRYLQCVAHDRSIDCELGKARIWAEGVGVVGAAFAKNDEVCVPDLLDPRAGTVYRFDKTIKKDQDDQRYRSIFGVPISINPSERPWGAIVASSDRAHHFGASEALGLEPEEAARALAGIVALAIAVCDANAKITAPIPPHSTGKGVEENTKEKRHARSGKAKPTNRDGD